jgi:hypothetical protein
MRMTVRAREHHISSKYFNPVRSSTGMQVVWLGETDRQMCRHFPSFFKSIWVFLYDCSNLDKLKIVKHPDFLQFPARAYSHSLPSSSVQTCIRSVLKYHFSRATGYPDLFVVLLSISRQIRGACFEVGHDCISPNLYLLTVTRYLPESFHAVQSL